MNENNKEKVTKGHKCKSDEVPLFLLISYEQFQFSSAKFSDESPQKYSDLIIVEDETLTYDNVGRLYLAVPYTGNT